MFQGLLQISETLQRVNCFVVLLFLLLFSIFFMFFSVFCLINPLSISLKKNYPLAWITKETHWLEKQENRFQARYSASTASFSGFPFSVASRVLKNQSKWFNGSFERKSLRLVPFVIKKIVFKIELIFYEKLYFCAKL